LFFFFVMDTDRSAKRQTFATEMYNQNDDKSSTTVARFTRQL